MGTWGYGYEYPIAINTGKECSTFLVLLRSAVLSCDDVLARATPLRQANGGAAGL